MTLGPIVMAAGTMLALVMGRGRGLVARRIPGITVFGLGLALMVAPLTATVLAAAPDGRPVSPAASATPSPAIGSLLAVAALPVAVGLPAGTTTPNPPSFAASYGHRDARLRGMWRSAQWCRG